MGNLTFTDPSVEQLVAMADGLMSKGQHALAADIYALALRHSKFTRQDIRVREGLARTPTARTNAMQAVLKALEPFQSHAFVSDGLATWLKTLPFFEDARFRELADKHRGLLPIPNWHWNLQTVLWAVQNAATVPGDFVELGVFKGHTTLFTAEYVGFGTWPKTWWLYDTFSGIPEDQLDPGWAKPNKAAYHGTFSVEEVRERFMPFPNVRVIQGRVPDALDAEGPEQIAFLHMDLNNATAEIAALDLLYPRIPPGGVIVFDDFCWASARAQYEAERRWFSDRGLHILPLPTGQGVFVKT